MTLAPIAPAHPAGARPTAPALRFVPVNFRQACAFIATWHRHLRPPRGHVFSIGVADVATRTLHGVAIVGRPVARHYDDGRTLEITRAATDGTPNVASMLLGRSRKVTYNLGFDRLITYNHATIHGPMCDSPAACTHGSCEAVRLGETGSSLRGAGWRIIAQRPPHAGWDRPSRPRHTHGSEGIARTLWEPDDE
ncbi:XF1762 family protein [Nonomuraea sp. NPDC050202]|uniref:XF1762 family protein n=1 Tax=Nonomuraea sp. NPDC050202 TaxID=3155035 RepID=UPI0033DA99D2